MKILFTLFFVNLLLGNSLPFKVGEILNYEASFSGVSSATGQLSVLEKSLIDGRSVIHVQFSAQSLGMIDFIFPIKDVIDIWLDEETLFPVQVEKNINEGSYKNNSITSLFQSDEYAIVQNNRVSIENGTHSPYSLFYFLRNESLENLAGKILPIINDKKTTQLQINIQNKIQVTVPSGTFLCTKVSPTRIDKKSFKNEAKMAIWFSNDPARIPVKIWLKMKFGALVLKLESISN